MANRLILLVCVVSVLAFTSAATFQTRFRSKSDQKQDQNKDQPQDQQQWQQQDDFKEPEEEANVEDLGMGNIRGAIRSGAFARLTRVKNLVITNSTITEIGDGVLCFNDVLEKLTIRFSKLPKIQKRMFGEKCPNIKVLEFNGNPTSFDDDSLQSLTQLKVLDMHRQEIDNLNKNFLNLPNLRTLEIKQSRIKKIEPDAMENLRNLKELNMRDMEDRNKIPERMLKDVPKLEYLNLDGADLSRFSEKDVGIMENLQTLQIAGSNIEQFDVDRMAKALPKLEVIDISDNMMTCDDLKKVAEELKSKINNLTVYVYSSAKDGKSCMQSEN